MQIDKAKLDEIRQSVRCKAPSYQTDKYALELADEVERLTAELAAAHAEYRGALGSMDELIMMNDQSNAKVAQADAKLQRARELYERLKSAELAHHYEQPLTAGSKSFKAFTQQIRDTMAAYDAAIAAVGVASDAKRI